MFSIDDKVTGTADTTVVCYLHIIERNAKVQVEVSSNKGIKCFCVQVRGVQLVSLPSAFMIDFRPRPVHLANSYLESKVNVKATLSLKLLDSTR